MSAARSSSSPNPRTCPTGRWRASPTSSTRRTSPPPCDVTRSLGIADAVALSGMYKAIPDIGACTFWQLPHRGRVIEFVNIFAANDLESTITIWQRLGLGNPGRRADLRPHQFARRPHRSFAPVRRGGGDRPSRRHYVLIGGIPESVQRRFEKAGSVRTPGRHRRRETGGGLRPDRGADPGSRAGRRNRQHRRNRP